MDFNVIIVGKRIELPHNLQNCEGDYYLNVILVKGWIA